MTEVKTIYITGTGRSGTNILKSIFSQHSKVTALPFESRFAVDPRGVLDFYNTFPALWSPYWADYKIKDFEEFLLSLARLDEDKIRRTKVAKSADSSGLTLTPPPYSGWELNEWIPGYSKYVNELIVELTQFKYHAVWPGSAEGSKHNQMIFASKSSKQDLVLPLRKFLEACSEAIRSKASKEILVDDNTHSLLFAADLLEICTDAFMIHVVRDPRDVIASLIKQRWAPNEIEQAVDWYLNVMHTWDVQKQQLDQTRFIEIRFEDIIRTTQLELEKLTRSCKLDFEPLMLDVDLSKHNIGRFKNDLTTDQIKYIEEKAASIMQQYAYLS